MPLLEGLRRAHPDASFGAVCSPANDAVFSNRIAPVHVLARAESISAVCAAVAAQAYSHAIVATEEVAGYEIARASGAVRCVGFWHRFEKPFKSLWQASQLTDRVYRPARWTARPEHEVEALYRLALPFGAPPSPTTDASSLRPWLALEQSDDVPEKALAFQVTRKVTSDGWGPVSLAGAYAQAWSMSGSGNVVMLTGDADQGLARSLYEHLPSVMRERTHLMPPSSVPRWFGVIARLGALVTPDTGAAHAAGMLGVPVVDLFDGDRFDQLSRQWRPWAAAHRCLVKPHADATEARDFGAAVGKAVCDLMMQGAHS